MTTQIQVKRDTAANWTAANPVLAAGEVGWESDTNQVKIGDGTTAWTTLSYFSPGTLAVTAWTTLSLGAGVASNSASFGFDPAYRKVGDIVYLRGVVKPTSGSFTGGTTYTLGTMPVGFRPPAGPVTGVAYTVGGATGLFHARVEVNSVGDIKAVPSGTTGWMGLDATFFSTS